MKRIYLDNNATTEIDPRVLEAMYLEMKDRFGNPSSIHSFGQEARNRLTKARRNIASFLGVKPSELIFTSSGSEAVNMILKGAGGHIITTDVEHSCVFATARHLSDQGRDVTFLPAGESGAVSADQVQAAIQPKTSLIAIMAVNNETGVKTDIEAIARIAEQERIPLFVDAVALVGKEIFEIPKGVSALCFSGHKFHAPKGVGGLFLRSSFKVPPLISGGHQENHKRAGTENTAAIVALEEAFAVLKEELPEVSMRMAGLRDHFESRIQSELSDVFVNGTGPRVCNTSNLSFIGLDGESLLMNFDLAGLAVSHGAACSSGSLEPSRVLINMGLSKERAKSSIRFSLSRFTTRQEIDRAVDIIVKVAGDMRVALNH